MPTTFNAAILGGGFIGKVHAYAYATLPFYSNPVPADVRVRYVVCEHETSARATAALLPGAVGSTDWEAVVADPEIDIVNICTPNHLHFPMLKAAIQAGKHIYCEKPVVANSSEAEELEELLNNYHKISHMTFHTRFFASAQKARQMIREGKLGRITEFRGAYLQNSHVDPTRPVRWKNLKENGGGALTDIGSHLLDLTDWLVDGLSEVRTFSTSVVPDDPRRAEDTLAMIWNARCGAIGTLHVSKAAHGAENDLTLEIYGTAGALRFDIMNAHYLEYFDGSRPTSPLGGESGWTRIPVGNRYLLPDTDFPATKSGIGWTRAHATCLADFLRQVASGTPSDPAIDLRRGVYIQKLMTQVTSPR